jgi:hypothetical protein
VSACVFTVQARLETKGERDMSAERSETYEKIVHLFGPIDSHRILEILELDPSPAELEVAASYFAGMTDVMGEERQPLAGNSANIYEIIIRDEPTLEDDQPRS